MQRHTMPPITVVRSETHVEIELLRLSTVEVEFASREEEAAYERADFELSNRIERAITDHFPSEPQEELLYTNHDWWPNKSRSVVLSKRAFCAPVVSALSSLLVGEYTDWKIHVTVREALGANADDAEVGSMCLMADRVIAQESLYGLFKPEA